MSNKSKVSIITPAYNSAHLLDVYFQSLAASQYKDFEVVLNDDLRSTDDTKKVVNKYVKTPLKIKYLKKNRSMAQGRKRAVDEAEGDILMHLDTDMQVTPGLIGECVDKLTSEFDALVVPEESFGTTFWAKCKWLEKKCYEGVDNIEALRVMKTDAYKKVDGHNVEMVFSEDKDLDIRIREAGYKVGRTVNFVRHNEGALKLSRSIKKKLFYTETANLFKETHPEVFMYRANVFNRYGLFLKNAKYVFSNPVVYLGLWFMVTCEFGAGTLRYATLKLRLRAR
jgi:glycosyltransferase involved in cell wall biosynthesis